MSYTNVKPITTTTTNTTNPSYFEFIIQSLHYFSENIYYLFNGQYTWHKFSRDLTILVQQVTILDLLMVTMLSIGLTLARHFATRYIFLVSELFFFYFVLSDFF